jgi:hypothetical protein
MMRRVMWAGHQPEEEDPADEAGDNADRHVFGRHDDAGDGVGTDEEDRSEQGGKRQHARVVAADSEADEVGHHQADKADEAGEGHHDAGDQRARHEDGQAEAGDGDAEGGGGLITEGHRVQRAALAPEPEAGGDKDGEGVDQVAPLGKAEAAKHPEDDSVGGLGIAEEDQDVGPGHDDEADGDPGEDQAVGGGGLRHAGDHQDKESGGKRPAEGHEGNGEEAEEEAGVKEGGDGPEGPARGDAEEVGVGEGVSGDGLQRCPGDPEARADEGGEEGAGEADVPDDGLTPFGPVGGDEAGDEVVRQDTPDGGKGHGDSPDRHGEEDGKEQDPAATQHDSRPPREAQGGGGGAGERGFGHVS